MLAALVVAEVGWAYEKTPQLFTGDPSARVAAREAAGRWLAATSRPDDVFFGYEPLYLEASKHDDDVAHIVDPARRLEARGGAARRAAAAARPRRLGVRRLRHEQLHVHARPDDRRSGCRTRRATTRRGCSARSSCSARVSRRGRRPQYLDRAAQVMIVGKSLFIGDADINFATVRRAADRLRLLDY